MTTNDLQNALLKDFSIIDVTNQNVDELGIFCIKDKKQSGFTAKVEWFKNKINKGLVIKIAFDSQGKQLGFIEYLPSEIAWRPVKANNYLFIQCIGVFVKDARQNNIGYKLLQHCEKDAPLSGKSGICTMSSDGPWMANKSIFIKNGFQLAQKLERYELMYKAFDHQSPAPCFIDWTKNRDTYQGWHLVYADQCPWHDKSVNDLKQSALENGIELTITKLTTPEEAQNAPSGFGTFSLIHNGKLLDDHYLSRTRFENILKNEAKAK